MKAETKQILFSGIFQGIFFAAMMAAFDYSDGKEFNLWRLILAALFFGIIMGIFTKFEIWTKCKKKLK